MAPAGRQQGHPKTTIGTPKGDIVDHNRTTPSMEEDRIYYLNWVTRTRVFRLMVKVLAEYEKGTDSPFYPWLNSLPRRFYNGASMTGKREKTFRNLLDVYCFSSCIFLTQLQYTLQMPVLNACPHALLGFRPMSETHILDF